MFAIIMVVAGLVFALLGAAVANRTGVKGVPAKKKPDSDTDPFELQRERSMERSSEHELDNTAARSNYLEKDERAKSPLTHEDMLNFYRLFHPELHELEAKPKKKPFLEMLREHLADVKPPARDLSRDRDRGRERGMER